MARMMNTAPQEALFSSRPDPPRDRVSRPSPRGPCTLPALSPFTVPGGLLHHVPSCVPWLPSCHLRQLAPGAVLMPLLPSSHNSKSPSPSHHQPGAASLPGPVAAPHALAPVQQLLSLLTLSCWLFIPLAALNKPSLPFLPNSLSPHPEESPDVGGWGTGQLQL